MNAANRAVVESNIPAAEPITRNQLGNGMTVKQRREQEDITAWLEMQEDAELEMLANEIANKGRRGFKVDDCY